MSSLAESVFDSLCPSSVEDDTFVPTIDMIVNDFDDEQTLNEEEGLASLEMQNPQDEIDMLREESEMPLEELLAKYQATPQRKKRNFSASGTQRKRKRREGNPAICNSEFVKTTMDSSATTDVIVVESDEDVVQEEPATEAFNNEPEFTKPLRTHLLELYPETYDAATNGIDDSTYALHSGEEDNGEDDNTDDLEKETDGDFIKKTIMVGLAYQADIPIGLSLYGDILPYENEDKLIWEPSQVSDNEVESYLLKARDIKPTLSDNDSLQPMSNEELTATESSLLPGDAAASLENVNSGDEQSWGKIKNQTFGSDKEGIGVVKDNEQALHLLVQCGYDFKEALRRKRLNAVPLTGTMSLWSEEECHKFEEGIQKYGKDFMKIRQNQVRTRTMRELVQFYYQWKKSERRDQSFANTDTVDHMNIYLNEEGNYGSNTPPTTSLSCAPATIVSDNHNRKSNACTQNNFSIMTGSILSSSTNNTDAAKASFKTSTSRKGVLTSGIASEVTLTHGIDNQLQNAAVLASCTK